MGESVQSFDGLVLAGLAVVLGTGFIVSAMLALLSDGAATALVLFDSVAVATIIGVLLLLTGGAFGTSQRWARYLGVMSFGGVALFGGPAALGGELLAIVYTFVSFLVAIYLVFRNPISKSERTAVDESESATKVGSTIR